MNRTRSCEPIPMTAAALEGQEAETNLSARCDPVIGKRLATLASGDHFSVPLPDPEAVLRSRRFPAALI